MRSPEKRRMDKKVYLRNQSPFALLHFTGSKIFDIELRKHALTLGYTLFDHGLVRNCNVKHDHHGKKNSICNTNTILIAKNEKDIFDFFGLKYKSPLERFTFTGDKK